MQINRISVVGLGKLGLPLALLFAMNRFHVVGYDVFIPTIEKLRRGVSPIVEPGIQNLLHKHKESIEFSVDARTVIEKTEVTFIVVPTPSRKDGSFSSHYIEDVLKTLSPFLKKKETPHTFVVTSTISPGTMETKLKPLIERLTKKKVGVDISLCYSPELIALGSVISNIQKPDFLFIGESDTLIGKKVETIRKRICLNKPRVIHTNWVNAELIKLSLNAYITSKISFANMIARLCEQTPGADSEIVLQAIGQDSRIGTKYLKGGLGYGGPCFPRDTISLYSTIKKAGLNITLPLATHRFNQEQTTFIFKIVSQYRRKNDSIGILGLGYKQNTDVVEESRAVLLAQKLAHNNTIVNAYDPLANNNAKIQVPQAYFASSINECVEMSEIILIMTPWEGFKHIQWDHFENKTIIDCWRIIDISLQNQQKNRFIQLGTYLSSE